MKTTNRTYNDASGDFNRLSHFITDNYAFTRNYSTWCIGRFVDWKYGMWGNKLSTPGFWEKNAQLWFDGFGDLAAFAISEDGGPEFTILTMAGTRFLFDEILTWVLENWGDRKPALNIEIKAGQHFEAKHLERNGFYNEATFFTSHFDLTADPVARYPLEEGFSLVDMHAHPDYRAQRILREDGFGGNSDPSEEDIERTLNMSFYSHQSPIYHPQTDLCVMAPDGTLVSGCEALIDTRNVAADIERVCTHSKYRRRGFARAVIQECLYRLRDMGMQKAYITGYSPAAIKLYNSLGAYKRTESYIYKQTV